MSFMVCMQIYREIRVPLEQGNRTPIWRGKMDKKQARNYEAARLLMLDGMSHQKESPID